MKLQIKIDGKSYEAEVEILEEDASPGHEHYAPSESIPAAGAYAPTPAVEAHPVDGKLYRSPVTGLVITVNVAAGEQVQPNDVMLVLESMKMETTMTAHCAGRVKSVHVAPGDPVKLHQVLVELE